MDENTTTQPSTGQRSEYEQANCRSVCTNTDSKEALVSLFQHSRISIRYHTKRQRWFEKWHYTTVAFSAILGTSSFALILGQSSNIALYTTAIAAVMSTLDLILQFHSRAELHKSLKCKYLDLLSKINLGNSSLTDLENEQFLIEKDEPPTLKLLALMCHNEQCKAVGDEEGLCQIPWYMKLFKNLWSFDNWEPKPIELTSS